MKKLIICVLLAFCACNNPLEKEYHDYRVKVWYSDGTEEVLDIKSNRLKGQFHISNGCLAENMGKTIVCYIKRYDFLK